VPLVTIAFVRYRIAAAAAGTALGALLTGCGGDDGGSVSPPPPQSSGGGVLVSSLGGYKYRVSASKVQPTTHVELKTADFGTHDAPVGQEFVTAEVRMENAAGDREEPLEYAFSFAVAPTLKETFGNPICDSDWPGGAEKCGLDTVLVSADPPGVLDRDGQIPAGGSVTLLIWDAIAAAESAPLGDVELYWTSPDGPKVRIPISSG
jgi:hypothetical protein